MLPRAIASVAAQTRQPDQIVVSIDRDGIGAAANRNRALESATGEWVAFLDDDDEFLPDHLELLLATAEKHGADLVYPWYEGCNPHLFTVPVDGKLVDPLGVPWGPELEKHFRTVGNIIPITVLVRRDLLLKVGGFIPKGSADNPCEDWGTWERMLDAGAVFAHCPEVTWRWNGHGNHTSGRKWTDVYR
jgi:glycosyltransferase involved in cell wall biosynthesis